MFQAQQDGSPSGQSLVQLRPADGNNLPTDTVLEAYTLDEADLPTSYQWQKFSFSTVNGQVPGTGLCLVLQWVADVNSATVN